MKLFVSLLPLLFAMLIAVGQTPQRAIRSGRQGISQKEWEILRTQVNAIFPGLLPASPWPTTGGGTGSTGTAGGTGTTSSSGATTGSTDGLTSGTTAATTGASGGEITAGSDGLTTGSTGATTGSDGTTTGTTEGGTDGGGGDGDGWTLSFGDEGGYEDGEKISGTNANKIHFIVIATQEAGDGYQFAEVSKVEFIFPGKSPNPCKDCTGQGLQSMPVALVFSTTEFPNGPIYITAKATLRLWNLGEDPVTRTISKTYNPEIYNRSSVFAINYLGVDYVGTAFIAEVSLGSVNYASTTFQFDNDWGVQKAGANLAGASAFMISSEGDEDYVWTGATALDGAHEAELFTSAFASLYRNQSTVPPPNFTFLDGCHTADPVAAASYLGSEPTTDRVWLGWNQKVLAGRTLRASEQILFDQLVGGSTVGDAWELCVNNYNVALDIVGTKLAMNPAAQVTLFGDPFMRLNKVYTGDKTLPPSGWVFIK